MNEELVELLKRQTQLQQTILVQLYRIYDVLAVIGLQNTPAKVTHSNEFNKELHGLLDHHESGEMPFIAKTDFHEQEESDG